MLGTVCGFFVRTGGGKENILGGEWGKVGKRQEGQVGKPRGPLLTRAQRDIAGLGLHLGLLTALPAMLQRYALPRSDPGPSPTSP